MASPGRRLGARTLDALVLLPFYAAFLVVTLLIAAPHFGPIFPTIYANQPADSTPTPGFIWLYLTILACVVATGIVMVAYETVATATYGRTLGKAWLHIRPLRVDGTSLGWWRAFGRIAIYWVSSFLSWFGLLDPLWCLWDGTHQCLHDKVADTIVVNDSAPA